MSRFFLIIVFVFLIAAFAYAETGMIPQHASQHECKAACARPWLEKAIGLYTSHLKDPKTATAASQEELRVTLQKAYDCITGKSTETGTVSDKEE